MLHEIKKEVDPDLLAYLDELRKRVLSGGTVAITAMEECVGGTFRISGTSVADRHTSSGMLLDAALERLTR